MKSSFSLAVVVLTGSLGLGLAGTALSRADDKPASSQPAVDSKPVNTLCPVSGDKIDPTVTTVYDGKTYAFCCSDCVKKFNEDPAKYAAKAK